MTNVDTFLLVLGLIIVVLAVIFIIHSAKNKYTYFWSKSKKKNGNSVGKKGNKEIRIK